MLKIFCITTNTKANSSITVLKAKGNKANPITTKITVTIKPPFN